MTEHLPPRKEMSGYWIKIEITTPDKPEVIAVATSLRMDQDAVVGKLIRLWAWADINSIDGNSLAITEKFIDRLANKKGFATALRNAGWLQGKDGCITFPDFSRHNGKSAKNRAQSNRRVSDHREKGNARGVTKALRKALRKALPDIELESLEREREQAAPKISKNISPDAHQPLRDLTNSLRMGWQAAPAFSPDEEAAFLANLHVLRSIPSEIWPKMRDYLDAKLPEGTGEWQPRQRIMFLRRPGDLASPATSWHHKRPTPPRPKLAAAPTPEEEAQAKREVAEWLAEQNK